MSKTQTREAGGDRVGTEHEDARNPVEEYIIKDPERFALKPRADDRAGREGRRRMGRAAREGRGARHGRRADGPTWSRPFPSSPNTGFSDPSRALEAQTRLYFGLHGCVVACGDAGQRREDRRRADGASRTSVFQDPEWSRNAFFDFPAPDLQRDFQMG